MSKTGILGGTFNPIHNGHLSIALNAIEEFKLDKVILIPTGISYFKLNDGVPNKNIRLEMTRLVADEYEKLQFSDIEVKRDGYSYTAVTIKELLDSGEDDLYFIVGADTLFSIEKWKNPEYIFENITIICTVRDDIDLEKLNEKAKYLEEKFSAKILISKMKQIDISSTNIRDMIANGNYEQAKKLLPQPVYNYIIDNKLY